MPLPGLPEVLWDVAAGPSMNRLLTQSFTHMLTRKHPTKFCCQTWAKNFLLPCKFFPFFVVLHFYLSFIVTKIFAGLMYHDMKYSSSTIMHKKLKRNFFVWP